MNFYVIERRIRCICNARECLILWRWRFLQSNKCILRLLKLRRATNHRNLVTRFLRFLFNAIVECCFNNYNEDLRFTSKLVYLLAFAGKYVPEAQIEYVSVGSIVGALSALRPDVIYVVLSISKLMIRWIYIGYSLTHSDLFDQEMLKILHLFSSASCIFHSAIRIVCNAFINIWIIPQSSPVPFLTRILP